MDFVPNYDARFHQFERMIDGDTSLTTTGERIRFTGVNTPGKDLCHYAETNKTVFDLLTDREVYFDKDEQASGNAHRLLRYVFLRSNDPTIGDLHVNKYIVEQGLGRSSGSRRTDVTKPSSLLQKTGPKLPSGVFGPICALGCTRTRSGNPIPHRSILTVRSKATLAKKNQSAQLSDP